MGINQNVISIRGAKEHNLQNVSIDIPRYKLVVFSGVSGSGKSSLAFDTIYAEGRRRYIESLSSYARQFLEIQSKPNVESITGLSPAIAIDQKTTSKNPRSTVATATEIYDYIRILFARIGVPYSPITGLPIEKQSPVQIVEKITQFPIGTEIQILVPIVKGKKGEYRKDLIHLRKQGFKTIRIDGITYSFDDLPLLDKNIKHDIDLILAKTVISESSIERLASLITSGLKLGNGLIVIEILALPNDYNLGELEVGQQHVFSEKFACPISGFSLTEIEPRLFSFNSPYGACPNCDGLGTEVFFDPLLIIPNHNLPLSKGAIAPWVIDSSKGSAMIKQFRFYEQTLLTLSRHYQFSLDTEFTNLEDKIQNIILYGSNDIIEFHYDDGYRKTTIKSTFDGVIPNLEKMLQKTESNYMVEELAVYQNTKNCSSCRGYRLKTEALCVKIVGKQIGEVCAMSVNQAMEWFERMPQELNSVQKQIADRVLKEITRRLSFLLDVGLDYLTLNRRSYTLSGGENQRIRLASQIGSGLSGVLYVLDEPSIGLHQRDNDRLLNTLYNLRDLGNTVIVVEHDEDTIKAADYLVDVGLGAGTQGGNIIAQGTPEEVANNPYSLTGQYLAGKQFIPVPLKRRSLDKVKYIEIIGAKSNNLKNIDVKLPLGSFVAITGVSGSGKSTFTIHTLYKAAVRKLHGAKTIPGDYESLLGLENVDKVIEVDQSPIGRTPRSNPATYTAAFTPIRDWFASLPESKSRGYNSGRFSFNVKGGRCESCEGDGVIKIEMHFLPDVYVQCEECKGKRYNQETLQILYNNCSIADILEMNSDTAADFFRQIPNIYEKLSALQEVGLGYIKIGQAATTLSGGEAQRVKLAKELARKSTGRTLYILDEPTTGLHSHDIKKLLTVLHKLVDHGNTVIVIEHNLDVIKTADYVVDIGPYGGDKGGELVVSGTPEEIAACERSVTGEYLKKFLTRVNI